MLLYIMLIINGGYADTYYVYDNYGQLAYILPPELSDELKSRSGAVAPDDELMVKYAFIYEYDHRNRCTGKKLPGADWVRMVYDNSDLLIATEDGNQRQEGRHTAYAYDRLGRLAAVETNGGSYRTDYGYNVRGWLTEISSPNLDQTLRYETAYEGSTPCWNGNISSITSDNKQPMPDGSSVHGGSTTAYLYDGMGRLTAARYAMLGGPSDPFYRGDHSASYAYDLNSNIVSLVRKGQRDRLGDGDEVLFNGYGTIDSLAVTLDGNRLLKVTDNMEEVVYGDAFDFHDGADEDVEYEYDSNGNMTVDLNRGIKEITYDVNNRPVSVTFSTRPAEQRTKYLYDASGRKLRTTYQTSRYASLGPDDLWHVDSLELNPGIGGLGGIGGIGGLKPLSLPASSIGGSLFDPGLAKDPGGILDMWQTSYVRDYCGDIIYKDGEIERILTDNGYAVPDAMTGGYEYYYYVKDWQGNVRAVIDEANRRMELNNYYPYGMPMSSTASIQPYKYGGKELDRTNGLDMYDYGARWYDMIVPHFITIDPLAEKYPSISPYVYCAGNPIRYVDYRGDSISLAPIQKLDQTLNSNFTQTILSDLNNITGLSLTVSSDGILTYKNQIGEKAEGSMTARNMLIAAIENKDMVSVMTAHRSASPIGKNEIWLGIRQIDNFINGASNVNKLTLGWGMTFLHELLHTNVGGALQDFPYNPGPVVEIMNTIRSELNGNFGQRMQYNAKAINGSSYIPFDDLSDSFLRNGLSPHPNSMFIKF